MNPAQSYEDTLVPASFAPSADKLLARAWPKPGERALDIACGTGIVARKVAKIVGEQGRVVAADVSPLMLEVARACAEREGVKVEFHEARVGALPFKPRSFDLVTCQHALQYFPDKVQAITEMARMCNLDGRLAISVWASIDQQPLFDAMNEAARELWGAPAFSAPFSYGDAEALAHLMLRAGFTNIDVQTVSIESKNPPADEWLRFNVEAASAALPGAELLDDEAITERVKAMRRKLARLLARFEQGGALIFPMALNVAVARS